MKYLVSLLIQHVADWTVSRLEQREMALHARQLQRQALREGRKVAYGKNLNCSNISVRNVLHS